jgi:hypothetical protein
MRGSLHWMQRFVNERPAELSDAVVTASGGRIEGPIEWISPLESDDFAEYRDQSFLDRLGVSPSVVPLEEFWPRRGAQWDALGRDGRGCPVLVEAKGSIGELISSPSAAGESALPLIRNSLEQTAQHLRASSGTDWTRTFYQYTNRLAHLYFLHELNGIKSWLVFLYFVGDETIPGRPGPKTEAEWRVALEILHGALGLKRHRLLNRKVDAFVNVGTP